MISNAPDMDYGGYIESMKEISFVFENIDKELKLFQEVKKNLSERTEKTEPLTDMIDNAASAIGKAYAEIILASALSAEQGENHENQN